MGGGGVPPACVPVTTAPVVPALAAAGVAALAGGLWRCWTVLRST